MLFKRDIPDVQLHVASPCTFSKGSLQRCLKRTVPLMTSVNVFPSPFPLRRVAVIASSVALGVMSGFAFGFIADLTLQMVNLYYDLPVPANALWRYA